MVAPEVATAFTVMVAMSEGQIIPSFACAPLFSFNNIFVCTPNEGSRISIELTALHLLALPSVTVTE